MRDRIKRFKEAWKGDYQFSTVTSSAFSALINVGFTLFNGVLGIVYQSLWHGSICVYFFLLAMIRAVIINAQRKERLTPPKNGAAYRKKISIGTHILLLLMNASLIVPIAIMVNGERSYSYGLIPAIAMAAYTTYRIAMGVIHLCKSKKNDNPLVSELRLINMIDALLAVLTLQNTLIIANGGMGSQMKTLSAWTSAGIFAVIAVITIRSFLKVKEINK